MNRPQATTIWDDLMQKAAGFREASVILTALETGMLESLREAPTDARALARKTGTTPRAVEILCNALVALGYLKKRGDAFSIAPALKPYLDPGSPRYRLLGLKHIAHTWHNWSNLPAVARGAVEEPGRSKVIEDPESNRNFIMAMQQLNPGRENQLAAALDLGDSETFCDVGPGPGHYSVALAKKYPRMRFTLVDHENSLSVAREFVGGQPQSVRARFSFVVGDMIEEARPDWGGPFDAILLSNVIHIFSAKDNTALVKRMAKLLNPRGVLIVRDFDVAPDHTKPVAGAMFAVNMLAGTREGRTYSVPEVKEWMQRAGLSRIKRQDFPPSYLVLGYK